MYWDDLQAMVDDQFENASNIYTIQKMNNTTGLYEEIIVRLDTPYELKLKTSVSNDFRKVIFKDSSVSTLIGDIYKFNDSYWICTDGGTIESPTSSCIIERCNNTLQFYDSTSTLHSIPCIISKGSISLDEQKIISTLDSEIAVQISYTDVTRQIPMNYVFKIGLRNYTVTDINDITVNGLLLIKMVYSEVEQIIPSYSLTILNGDLIQVNENDQLTINAQVKIDGIIASPMPNLLFSSSNIAKATINSITGVVTILDVGNVVFSCKMENDLSVMDEINVEIVEVSIENKTVEISGSTSIIKTYTKEYLAVFKNNGLSKVKESSFWLTGIDNLPTSLAVITSQNAVNNTCEIKGNNLGSIKIWCKSLDEEIVSQDGMIIQVKSLF